MNWLMIKNDFKRNKVINAALFLFMMFAVTLAVLSIKTGVQTFSAINELYEKADPPHFLQLHKGDYDEDEVAAFMDSQENVIDWQTVAMIDIYGNNLILGQDNKSIPLSDCRIDIGLVKQNEKRDLLLNASHERVELAPGEIGVPVILRDQYDMKLGDTLTIDSDGVQKEFVITEFILDSQMNSSMCSSTRILLSDEDYNALYGNLGELEYIIEAYFNSTSESNAFQTIYENADMPQNGQAITYTIMFLLSAMTDLVTVLVLLFVSILLLVISFLCVRFTIMAALEEDLGEIGTMKSIGIPYREIRGIYLIKYRFLSIIATIVGFIVAYVASGLVMNHIQITFGAVPISVLCIILTVVMAIFVCFLMNAYCKKVLKAIKRLTVVDALVNGKGLDRAKNKVKDGLHRSKKLSVNTSFGLRTIRAQHKNYKIVGIVTIIATLMILIPWNLITTMQSPDFVTYMGSSKQDILIEIESGKFLEEGHDKVSKIITNSELVTNYREMKRVCVQTINTENEVMNLRIDCGTNAGIGLQYLNGRAPQAINEIALSYLNAQALGKSVGDTIDVTYDKNLDSLKISGIYQDVTSGGYTAKMNEDFSGLESEKYSFTVNLVKGTDIDATAKEWSKVAGDNVTVDAMEEFLDQTLGGVVNQLKSIVIGIIVISICLVLLIAVLFLKLRLAKDQTEIAT